MLIALWIVNALLALALFGSGLIKIIRTPPQLAAAGMHWTTDTTTPIIKLIGAAEAVAAIGLVAPLATGIAPILTPLAAVGATLIMAGACVVHLRRRESPAAAAVLTALSLASAILGFISLT